MYFKIAQTHTHTFWKRAFMISRIAQHKLQLQLQLNWTELNSKQRYTTRTLLKCGHGCVCTVIHRTWGPVRGGGGIWSSNGFNCLTLKQETRNICLFVCLSLQQQVTFFFFFFIFPSHFSLVLTWVLAVNFFMAQTFVWQWKFLDLCAMQQHTWTAAA